MSEREPVAGGPEQGQLRGLEELPDVSVEVPHDVVPVLQLLLLRFPVPVPISYDNRFVIVTAKARQRLRIQNPGGTVRKQRGKMKKRAKTENVKWKEKKGNNRGLTFKNRGPRQRKNGVIGVKGKEIKEKTVDKKYLTRKVFKKQEN